MKFTVTPEEGEPVILTDGSSNQSIGWYLVDSMVEGWFGTPAPRESAQASVGHDGDGFPSTLTQGPRVVTLYGAADCASHIEAAAAKDKVNALFGQRLEIRGEDADGAKRCYGYMSDDPQPKYLPTMKIVKFAIVITCPYPVKLGEEVPFEPSGGICIVSNPGNALSYPRIEVDGPISSLTASFDGHVFSWSGSARGLVLDMMDASCTSGTVTSDDAFGIPHGEHAVFVSAAPATASVAVVVASAWR